LKKNSQLEAENKEYQRRLEVQVIEQTYQITSQSGFVNHLNSQSNLEEILTLVEEYTRQCISCDHVAVLLREEEFSDKNGYFGIFTRPPKTFRIAAEKKPIFPKLFSKKITLLNQDNPLERQILTEIVKEAGLSTGLPFIVATLKRGAYPFGLILVSSNSISQATLGDKDKEMFEFIADSASIAINNQLNHIKLEKGYFDTVKALALAVEAKDPYTRGHSDRVRLYATLIGKKLGLSEKDIKVLGFAGILHDIGKIGTPMEIINKNGPLTGEEWNKIKEHPAMGEKMIAHIEFLEPVRKIIRHHHERIDGAGYPDRISGEQLCLGARILAVADTYDAMTSSRPYRNALSQSEALTELIRYAGIQFDRNCVKAFLEVHAEHLMEHKEEDAPYPEPQVMQI
jgi:putative nucleotidyltransferase with HDIG domain